MHMHFQYIKCWLDKGFNKLDKINKKSRFFFVILGFEFDYITTKKNLYGSCGENIRLGLTLKFEGMNEIQNVNY